MKELLTEGFAALGVTMHEEAAERLETYWRMLEEKNRVMNLTAITAKEEVARQHFLDCGALLAQADFHQKRVIDIGSGAGFPGLVLKILDPSIELTMLDSLGMRVEFQKEAVAALALTGVHCINGRAEEQGELRGSFDLATARAVARLNMLAELCLPFVKKGGCFVAMKGPAAVEELQEAKHAISVLGGTALGVKEYTVPGTDLHHSAVLIRKSGVTPPQYPRRWAKIKQSPL